MGIFDKINENQIVGKTPVVSSDDPDLITFLNPNKVIVVKGGKSVISPLTTNFSTINPLITAAPNIFTKPDEIGSAVSTEPKAIKDVPDLTDIEVYKNEKYWDSAKKQERARLVIKVKNNSQYKTEVIGIDARIYNPAEEK